MQKTTHFLRSRVFLFALGISIGIAGTSIAAGTLGSYIFDDVPFDSYYNEAVGELSSLGIIQGYADGRFGPDDYVTRGQISVLLQRLRNDILGEDVIRSTTQTEDEGEGEDEEGDTEDEEEETETDTSAPVGGSIRFTIGSYTVSEIAGWATISVVRTGSKAGIVSVDYTASGGTATPGDDFEMVSGTLRFSDGETSRVFCVSIHDDELQEGNETIGLILSDASANARLTVPSTATITITDNEQGSSLSSSSSETTVQFSALAYGVAENGNSVSITVERSGETDTIASVKFAVAKGTASSSAFADTDGTLTFNAGQTEKTFLVTVYDDGQINGNKTIKLSLSEPSGAVLGDRRFIDLTIMDDEISSFGSGALKFAHSIFECYEYEEEGVIEVVRTGGADGTVGVSFATKGGTAVAGSDYRATSGTLTFRDGETKKSFIIPVINDTQMDGGEKITIQLSDPTGGATIGAPDTSTLMIN